MGFGNAVLLVLNLSTLGTVAYKGRIWQPETESPEPLSEMLDLSTTQARSIEAKRNALAADWELKLTELRDSRERLIAAIKDETADPNELWPLIDRIGSMQTQLERQAVNQLLQERALLDPQQQEQYFSHLENRLRQGRGYGRGFRGGRMRNEGTAPDESFPRGQRKGRKGGARWQ
jgi:Spy/CpxP family protein refolding chaperone